jgi:hypothetical protein
LTHEATIDAQPAGGMNRSIRIAQDRQHALTLQDCQTGCALFPDVIRQPSFQGEGVHGIKQFGLADARRAHNASGSADSQSPLDAGVHLQQDGLDLLIPASTPVCYRVPGV